MKTCSGLVFSLFTFITVLSISNAFHINPPPASATQNQVVTLTWFRDQHEPTTFQFAKSMAGETQQGSFDGPVSVGQGESQGTVSAFFIDAGKHVNIVAYNLNEHPEVDDAFLRNPGTSKPSPFFIEPNQVIIVSSIPPGDPPNQPPTTTNQTPAITPTSRSTQNTNQGGPTTASPTITTGQSASKSTTGTNSLPASTSFSSSGGSTTGSHVSGTDGVNSNASGGVSASASATGTQGGQGENTDLPPSPTSSAGGDPTVGSSSPVPSHPLNLGVIVGVILGVLAFIVLILLGVCIHRRKQRKRSIPARLEAFYREKMIRSEERLSTPVSSILEPLNTRASVISGSTATSDVSSLTSSALNTAPDAASLQAPDYTIYTITESSSIVESFDGSDYTTTVEASEDYHGVGPRTDRQMDIEKTIFQLQEQLINVLDRSRSTDDLPTIPQTIGEIKERIKRLRELQEGEWAREVCDEPPNELFR